MDAPAGPHTTFTQLFVRNIEPNPLQPRRWFDEQALAELAASIKVNGLVQPVLVRRKPHSDQALAGEPTFQLVAGERRWRAAKLAGMEVVPAIVKPLADDAMLEIALTENLHRQDLNPIERAAGYRGLIRHRNLSQDQVADRMGESRTSITNHLRLLELPDEVQELIAAGKLSFGQAKPLTGLKQAPNKSRLAGVIVRDDWTVRQVERVLAMIDHHPEGEDFLTKVLESDLAGGLLGLAELDPNSANKFTTKGLAAAPTAPADPPEPAKPAHIVALEEKLTRRLGTRVLIRQGRRPDMGKVVVDFYCLDDFDRILEALGVSAD